MNEYQIEYPRLWVANIIAALALFIVVLLSGCSSTNVTKLVQAAAKDPASVKISVRSPWGTVDYERTNPAATNAVVQKGK